MLALAALVFASLVLTLFLGAGLLFGGWFWWRSRKLRRAVPPAGIVIEGEFRKVPDPRLEDRSR